LLPSATFLGCDDICATSCSGDSRCLREGDLFVAIQGTQFDGHEYADEAAARGASALLAQRAAPGCALPTCLVRDSRDAYGRVCQALAGNPSHSLKVIGVTGTNGKTTTSYLIAAVLEAGGLPSGVSGTLGQYDGVELKPTGLTTPTAPQLARYLADTQANGCTHAAVEVSSHALALLRMAGVDLDVACVTNVQHDHFDFHGSAAEYLSAKRKIFDLLSPDGVAVLNADDPKCADMLDWFAGPVLTVGIDRASEISAVAVEQTRSEQTFLLNMGHETVPVRTTLIGRHNIYNCLVAAAVGMVYGLEPERIARGLESIEKVPGRLERLECGQPFGVFIDYAHTPDALLSTLTALRSVTQGRVICVFGAGGDRDRVKRPLMGEVAERHADVVVLTSDNPRTENPKTIIGDILSGTDHPERMHVLPDRAAAIRWALEDAVAGDCVLIAGKGHEDYQIIGHRRYPFDDREVACQWLYGFSAKAAA
jgi:UDP-N-acetylmuramoyl-L-alanyl-D-glutamate--2,6-diaminopimelate ligase